MKRKAALLGLALASCCVSAADPAVERMEALFTQFDADRNGALSAAEQRLAVETVRRAYGNDWSRRIGRMFARAAAPDQSVSNAGWQAQLALYTALSACETVMISMRDG